MKKALLIRFNEIMFFSACIVLFSPIFFLILILYLYLPKKNWGK